MGLLLTVPGFFVVAGLFAGFRTGVLEATPDRAGVELRGLLFFADVLEDSLRKVWHEKNETEKMKIKIR